MADVARPSFEPVLLDLADSSDYYILTEALSEFISVAEHNADNEDVSERYEGRDPSENPRANSLRAQAERARVILADVERQLDANSAARRPSP
ncbi:hypothetical protein GRS96_20340 (plasmid) [Rathayibacter sp. VKM Ac-2803]|uniref:hypothetical protein n=1 Tax=Rathayibacter sp. VKM Ac-2803 TaxID=2609256 RepID=UPI00135AD16B|nr:hypothetical protein [Rathayibacter sp. VKM Ac-2803]MWV51617.1 hypothetical protein [Rathayibacter sp. VKM Ac-2803]